jgi:hypothetical protein
MMTAADRQLLIDYLSRQWLPPEMRDVLHRLIALELVVVHGSDNGDGARA